MLASRWLLGWRTVCAVERDPYRQAVLLARQQDGCLDPFPIWDDARTFDGRPWRGIVDVVTAGFPCQPFSLAGKRRAEADERNGWPDTIRILREVRPRYALLENVPGLAVHPYFQRVLGDIAESGLDAEWDIIPAAAVGAIHLRWRLWIAAADAHEWRREELSELHSVPQQVAADGDSSGKHVDGFRDAVSNAKNGRAKRRLTQPQGGDEARPVPGGWWATEPAVGRVADGVAHRVDRLAALGDGQVPAVVERAWHALRGRIE